MITVQCSDDFQQNLANLQLLPKERSVDLKNGPHVDYHALEILVDKITNQILGKEDLAERKLMLEAFKVEISKYAAIKLPRLLNNRGPQAGHSPAMYKSQHVSQATEFLTGATGDRLSS